MSIKNLKSSLPELTKILLLTLFSVIFSCNFVLARQLCADTTLAGGYYQKAMQLREQEKFEESIVCLEKSAKLYKKDAVWENYLLALNEIAWTEIEIFKHIYKGKAMLDTLLPLSIEKTGELSRPTARCYYLIGVYYRHCSSDHMALNYVMKSYLIAEKIFPEYHPVFRRYNLVLGSICANLKLWDMAENHLKKGIEQSKRLYGENSIEMEWCYFELAELMLKKYKNPDSVLYYANKRIQLIESQDTIPTKRLAEAYHSKILFYRKINRISKTFVQDFEKADSLFRLVMDDDFWLIKGNTRFLTHYYQATENYDKAFELFQQSANELNPDFKPENKFDLPDLNELTIGTVTVQNPKYNTIFLELFKQTKDFRYLLTAFNFGKLHYDVARLRRYSQKEIDDKEKTIKYLGQHYTSFIKTCLLLDSLNHQPVPAPYESYKDWAFYFAEEFKAQVLHQEMTKADAQKNANVPQNLLTFERQLNDSILRYKILAQRAAFNKKYKYYGQMLNYKMKKDSLNKSFEKYFSKAKQKPKIQQSISIADIQQVLTPKSAVLSYALADKHVWYYFLITKDSVWIKELTPIDDFESKLELFRLAVTSPEKTFFKTFLRLGHLFYKQLFPENIPENIQKITIIPNRQLHMLPFEALLTRKVNSSEPDFTALPYLINRYAINYQYSARLFLRKHKKNKTYPEKSLMAMAPVFENSRLSSSNLRFFNELDKMITDSTSTRGKILRGNSVQPLPHTEKEVLQINKLFHEKSAVYLKEKASEAVLDTLDLSAYRYLHFATHGFVNATYSSLSGLLLSQYQRQNSSNDNILYVGEIYNLKLNAELVVLSACETGLGALKKGEGVIGLTRAFTFAGADNILASLWKVADQSTSDLVTKFYRQAFKNQKRQHKKDFSAALRNAKLKMISNPDYTHPFYWSAFVLIGG